MMMNLTPEARSSRSMPLFTVVITAAPQQRVHDPPVPSEQARPADHRGRDREQQELAAARSRVHRPQPRGQDDPAHARHEARDHEDGDPDPVDVDPRPPRRLGVAADGIDVPAEARPAGDERPEEEEGSDDHRHHGHAAVRVRVRHRPGPDRRHRHQLDDDEDERLVPQAARAPAPNLVQLDRGEADEDGGQQDPAGRIREEPVGDVEHRRSPGFGSFPRPTPRW